MTMIRMENGPPVLENRSGLSRKPFKGPKGWGLGTFALRGQAAGTPEEAILTEDAPDWRFCAPSLEVIEDTDERAEVRLFGQDSKILFEIRVTARADSGAIVFDYAMEKSPLSSSAAKNILRHH